MYRYLLTLLTALAIAAAASAHEFWIEPETLVIPEGGRMEPVLMIGEHPEGQVYAFQPQAYRQAIWSGPRAQIDLSRSPLSGPETPLMAQGRGLHSLAVATFPQKLTYSSLDELRKFLAEAGQEDLLSSYSYQGPPNGKIRETYRRFSKTIVHFADRGGTDSRVGLEREWVWQDEEFRLFEGSRASADQKSTISCTTGPVPNAKTRIVLYTDRHGAIRPALPTGSRCLINAIFAGYDSQTDQWHSDWVSLFFLAP